MLGFAGWYPGQPPPQAKHIAIDLIESKKEDKIGTINDLVVLVEMNA